MSSTLPTLPKRRTNDNTQSTNDEGNNAPGDNASSQQQQQAQPQRRGVTAPTLTIDPWLERSIYVFSAVITTIIIVYLKPLGGDNSVFILFLLIVVAVLIMHVNESIGNFSEKYAPKEFTGAFIVLLKMLEFISMVAVFLVSSYSVVLLGSYMMDGHLSFAEAATLIIIGVAFVLSIAVVHHNLRNSLNELEQQQQPHVSTTNNSNKHQPTIVRQALESDLKQSSLSSVTKNKEFQQLSVQVV